MRLRLLQLNVQRFFFSNYLVSRTLMMNLSTILQESNLYHTPDSNNQVTVYANSYKSTNDFYYDPQTTVVDSNPPHPVTRKLPQLILREFSLPKQ